MLRLKRLPLLADIVVVLGEQHLGHIFLSYLNYYNALRTHLSLGMHRFRAQCRLLAELYRRRSSAGYITNTTGLIYGRDNG